MENFKKTTTTIALTLGYMAVIFAALYLVVTLLFGAPFNVSTWDVVGRSFAGFASMFAGIVCSAINSDN